MTFDHLKLVGRQPREVKKFRRYLLGVPKGELQHLVIEHEHDNACCRREEWPRTLSTITRALGINVLHALLPDLGGALAGDPPSR
jgi:hypothetical protein